LQRLDRIRRIIDDPRLESLKTEQYQIPSFEPRPEPVLRAAFYLLTEAAKKAVNDGNAILKEAREDVKYSFFKSKVVLPVALAEKENLSYIKGKSVSQLQEPFNELATAIEQSQRNDLLALNFSRGKNIAEPTE
jgi:hypothetical protein